MENKYYAPSITEFHLGFKFEYRDSQYKDSEWSEETCTPISLGDAIFCEDEDRELFEKNYRVRYLNKEDIENLNFVEEYILDISKQSEDFVLGFIKKLNDSQCINLYIVENKIILYKQTIYNKISGNWKEEMLFNGRIKNIDELITLLKQLEI